MSEVETRPRWIAPMRRRSPEEPHRAATPLELFFDLVFVVAVAQAATYLHHGIAEGHPADALVSYCIVFFGIWWAWLDYTWFSSNYDNGDIPYRLIVFVQMTGALIVASGAEAIFTERNLTITVFGYVVMRIASVAQWVRVARVDTPHRPTAIRYIVGTILLQAAWVTLVFLPQNVLLPGFVFLALVETVVAVWAEYAAPNGFHAGHIRERFGLFTILVLGESILSTSLAIRAAVDESTISGGLLSILVGGLLIVYSMWWLYFYQPADHLITSLRQTFVWSYGHSLIFGATAAVGAGLAVTIDQITGHAEISQMGASMAVTIPIAIYVMTLWVLHEHPRSENPIDRWVHPIVVMLILLTPLTEQAILITGILLVILIAIRLVRHLE